MKLENKQELERLVHLVETGLDERLQVTPEVERQKRVIAAMQYSLDAGASGFVRCWCWNSAGSAAEECSRQWQQPAPLR